MDLRIMPKTANPHITPNMDQPKVRLCCLKTHKAKGVYVPAISKNMEQRSKI